MAAGRSEAPARDDATRPIVRVVDRTEFSIVITTTDSEELTERIASVLLERRLAACVQVSAIRSLYRWEGRVVDESEQLLAIKCRTSDYRAVEAAVSEVHTYDEPEIVRVPIEEGSAGYLAWIASETSRDPA